jgi:hypothetical protein
MDGDVVSGASIAACTFEWGMTSVEREGHTDFIDYTHLVLYRYSPTSEECRSYKLRAPGLQAGDMTIEDQVLYAKAQEIGYVEVLKVATHETLIRRYPVQAKKIIWGGKAAARRTAAEPALIMYGQLFAPAVEDYSVTTVIDRIDDLFRLAASHEAIYRANPLLRRLDPLGLLGGLQGIPVRIEAEDYVEELNDIRYGVSGEIVLPDGCRFIP